MTFSEFLRDRVLGERLREHRILVVFDDKGRYQQLCAELADNAKGLAPATGGAPSTAG